MHKRGVSKRIAKGQETEEDRREEEVEVVTGPNGICVVSVSYTHLDVYKRQVSTQIVILIKVNMKEISINYLILS